MLFQTIHDIELMLGRKRQGREASPSGAVIDCQSVKAPSAETRGFDAGKKIVGRICDIVEPLLTVLDVMARQLDELTKRVLEAVRVEPICRRLMTVPGVGPLTALTFWAMVDQPEGFRRSSDVGAHLGLTPRRYQSGETDIQGGISRCGDELARTALYEAAHTLLTRCQK